MGKNKILLELLEKSIISQDLKNSWRQNLKLLSLEQKRELVRILEEEQKMVNLKIKREKNRVYSQLLVDMKELAGSFTKKFARDVEMKGRKEDEKMLKSLEDKLNNP